MRSLVPACVLVSLVLGCGARHEQEERVEQTSTRGDEELASSDGARSADELARDPAWQNIPPDDRRRATPPRELDAGVVAPSCAGACGAEGEGCTDARGWRCRCEWHHDQVCGGAWREPNPPVLAWSCAPVDPRADRGDGCPFAAPAAGHPCPIAASAVCRYAEGCGWDGVEARCASGRWSLSEFHMPPPP